MRVIKLGGSLLDLPDLGVRLTRFLHELTPQDSSLILVGGGPIVDAVRLSRASLEIGRIGLPLAMRPTDEF